MIKKSCIFYNNNNNNNNNDNNNNKSFIKNVLIFIIIIKIIIIIIIIIIMIKIISSIFGIIITHIQLAFDDIMLFKVSETKMAALTFLQCKTLTPEIT